MFVEATRLEVQEHVASQKGEATSLIIKLILFLGRIRTVECTRTHHNKPIYTFFGRYSKSTIELNA